MGRDGLDVLREMARGQMVSQLFFQRRLYLGAGSREGGDRAARVETAARRRIERRGNLSLQIDQALAALDPWVWHRDRRQQRLRRRMLRVRVRAGAGGDLPALAEVHYHHPVAD